MISQAALYAIKALVLLATQPSTALSSTAISETEEIPKGYLQTVMTTLRKANIIRSTRGNVGGYRLARPASVISLSDIIQAIDGYIVPYPEPWEGDADGATSLLLQQAFDRSYDAFHTTLGETTLAHLSASRESSIASAQNDTSRFSERTN